MLFSWSQNSTRIPIQLIYLCYCIVQIGIFPGDMAKICPHTSTGRADYFGPAVNRAARLLCAAKAGQILVSSIFLITYVLLRSVHLVTYLCECG